MDGYTRRIAAPVTAANYFKSTSIIPRIIIAAAAICVLLLLMMDSLRAEMGAATPPTTRMPPIGMESVGREDVERGGLFFPGDEDGLYQPAPLVDTDIQGRISGMVGRYTVRHKFRNPGTEWVEGVYVFPLPAKAAVDSLKMIIGERVIEGRIDRKAQARRTYEAAKGEGRKASLVEQERPNIFTTSIANIGPGEEISVEIQFQQSLRYVDGAFRLRLPLVIGPRYIPGSRPVAGINGAGWGVNTQAVPDAARITPPVRPEWDPETNAVSLSLELDAGFPLAAVASSTHPIQVTKNAEGIRTIALKVPPESAGHKTAIIKADRDFALEWRPAAGQAPTVGLFSETVKGDAYALLMLMPPVGMQATERSIGREIIFVIDTSGSMHGLSMEQARKALRKAVERLKLGERFNIIRFNNRTHQLFDGARTVGPETVRRAYDYVNAMEAEGGTEILPALSAALDGRRDPTRIRQVVVLTDGAIGNEDAVFSRIAGSLGDTRLFTVGIGSAPNGHFMSRAARHGRGTYTFIGDVSQVEERMTGLFQKLERPALTSIAIRWPGGLPDGPPDKNVVESWPHPIPDLYAGEPLVVSARLPRAEGAVTITGRLGGAIWRTEVDLVQGRVSPGVGRVWAREKIATLEDSIRTGADPSEVRRTAEQTALDHQLVSKYTSLVAVDVTPSRPPSAPLATRPVPTEMPHGWSREHVFGESGMKDAMKVRKAKLAAPVTIGTALSAVGSGQTMGLPQGATAAELKALIGALALLLGLLTLAWARRRPREKTGWMG